MYLSYVLFPIFIEVGADAARLTAVYAVTDEDFTADALVDTGAAMLLDAAGFDCAVAVGSDEDDSAIVVPI